MTDDESREWWEDIHTALSDMSSHWYEYGIAELLEDLKYLVLIEKAVHDAIIECEGEIHRNAEPPQKEGDE